MFEEPDGQDAIWRNQKSAHGLALVKRWKLLTSCGVHVITLSTVQLFLLVERRYPLLRFILEQLVLVFDIFPLTTLVWASRICEGSGEMIIIPKDLTLRGLSCSFLLRASATTYALPSWDKDEKEAFQLLKEKLCSTPILALLDGSEDFVVYCDASHQGAKRYGARATGAAPGTNSIWNSACRGIGSLVSLQKRLHENHEQLVHPRVISPLTFSSWGSSSSSITSGILLPTILLVMVVDIPVLVIRIVVVTPSIIIPPSLVVVVVVAAAAAVVIVVVIGFVVVVVVVMVKENQEKYKIGSKPEAWRSPEVSKAISPMDLVLKSSSPLFKLGITYPNLID
nr:putative reverse transcriptase domain-containing protein [Tanacetum cinerariifolium]